MVILFHFRSFHENVNITTTTQFYKIFNHSKRFLMSQIDEMKMLFHRNWTIINNNNETALMANELRAAFSPISARHLDRKDHEQFFKKDRSI